MTHWAIALYERYVQLYGDPIEQPITTTRDSAPNPPSEPIAPDCFPPGEPRAQPSAPRSS